MKKIPISPCTASVRSKLIIGHRSDDAHTPGNNVLPTQKKRNEVKMTLTSL